MKDIGPDLIQLYSERPDGDMIEKYIVSICNLANRTADTHPQIEPLLQLSYELKTIPARTMASKAGYQENGGFIFSLLAKEKGCRTLQAGEMVTEIIKSYQLIRCTAAD